ncbi:hypothetical protein AnigIFM59636_000530 [Aspergillus niger]|nr:hypothetical protein AnigIFM59636_000530 [Aspergillus niger]
MSNNLTRKPSISASSLGEVRKIYMSKMTEQGCSRTLKDKCRDIWHEVINDAIDAEAECSMRGIAIVHEKKQEPAYIQSKGNGTKDSSEGDTESETETEESNSETEVEIDPSLDGILVFVWRWIWMLGVCLNNMSSPSRDFSPEDLDDLANDLKDIQEGLAPSIHYFISFQTGALLDHLDEVRDALDLQLINLTEMLDRLKRGLDQVKAIRKAVKAEENETSEEEEVKESEQHPHQHHATKSPVAKSPKHRFSPAAKVKVQESDGDADSEREIEAEKEDFETLFQ